MACARMYGYDLSPNEYYESVWTYSTGDDTIMASSDEMLTGQVVANFANEVLRMEFTDSSKSHEVMAKPLEEISYASRTFVHLIGHTNLYSGAVKKESISSALCWSETTDEVIITEVVKNALNETALHGKEDYERLCSLIDTSVLLINLQPYNDLVKELADQILTQPARMLLKTRTKSYLYLAIVNSPELSLEK